MHTSFFTSLVAALFAASTVVLAAAPGVSDRMVPEAEVFERDNCFHPSSCSSTWSGKCEDYCGSRGFSHMTGEKCGWPSKRCCCIRS
ncbi:hypothetical protein MN608_04188 [Microdochium nivale]|nr:hypothetical protein MN608_04188 [Microdochium nivale]